MSPEQYNDLKLRIYLNVEACCRKRGLIKKHNGYETYEEGLETFIDEQVRGIFKKCLREKAGKGKPFFTGTKGLEVAIDIACNKRINTFIREKCLQRTLKKLSLEEYLISIQGDIETNSEVNGMPVEVARPENITTFGEPVKGCNQSPESIFEETELKEAFDREHEKLLSRGKDGPLYYNVVHFYLYEFDVNWRKKDEISALSAFLGVDRKKTIEVKSRAWKFLFDGLSESFELDKCKKSMRHKRALKKLFKKISDKKLLEIYDTRYSLFLNPYLGQKIACTIRVLSISCNNKGQDPNSLSPPASAIHPKTSKFNEIA